METKINILRRKIIDIYDSLQNNSTEAAVKINMLKLESLLLKAKLNTKEEIALLNYDDIARALPMLQQFYEVFETNLENEFVKDFLAGKKEFSEYLLYKRFVKLITNEIKLGKISKSDLVLFIGSGPLPITAILLSKFIGCRVDCYDKNKIFTGISRKVVSELQLSDKIKVYNKKGEELAENKYSAIIVALLAKPKDKILARVWTKSKWYARIVCRTSDGIRQVFYELTALDLLKKYNIQNKIFAKGNQTISSVLLVK